MANFPTDQFDQLPDDLDRVGAHRGPKVRGRGWLVFLWAVVAVVVLTLAGIFGLQILSNGDQFNGNVSSDTSSATSTPTPTSQAITDGTGQKLTVTVLNGTSTPNLAKTAAHKLQSFHWQISSTANASVQNFAHTVVYYSDAKYKEQALGIANDLGFSSIALTTNFGGQPVTVVVGADYKG